MTTHRFTLALTCLLPLLPTPAWTQPELSKKQGPTIAELGAPGYAFEKRAMTSRDGERRYRIYVATPSAPPPAAGYPVIYMLDGNAVFEDLTAAALTDLSARSPAVIVGIGYDTDLRVDVVGRTFDYTPPGRAAEAAAREPRPERKAGGASLFLDFIEQDLKPSIERTRPINRRRQAIYGHSFGGLFVLHALFTRPAAFQTYIAASPSLWWGDGLIVKQETAAATRFAGHAARLLMMVGELEQRRQTPGSSGPGAGAGPRTNGNSSAGPARVPTAEARDAGSALTDRLSRWQGLQIEFRVLEGKAHGPMLPASVGPALQFAVDAHK